MTRLPDPRRRPWLTVAELAQITGEGEKAIRAAISAGTIPHLMVGRYVRIPTAALCRLLEIEPEDHGHHETPVATGSAPVYLIARPEIPA